MYSAVKLVRRHLLERLQGVLIMDLHGSIFSFSFEAFNSSAGGYGPEDDEALKVCYFDSSGDKHPEIMTYGSSSPKYTTIPSIGRFQSVSNGNYYHPLIGLYYRLSIYNTWNLGDSNVRTSFVNLHKDSYFLNFKLGDPDQNTYFDNKIQK